MRRSALVLCAVLHGGCAGLMIGPDDSAGTKTAKVAGRTMLGLLSAGVSESYYATDRNVKSWLGGVESDLVMAWGPPSQVLPDGSGGKFVVYTEQRSSVTPGQAKTTTTGYATGYTYGNYTNVYGQAESHTTYTPAQIHQWSVYRMFRINDAGEIIAYSWKGL